MLLYLLAIYWLDHSLWLYDAYVSENYIEAIKQFMEETKWIRVRGYPGSKELCFYKVQPFTKDQRNTIKDLEIFGYICII